MLGQDQLVYTVASGGEEDLATVLVEAHSLACRPVSIISFNSDCGSEAALASDSQLIDTTASEGTVENYHIPPGLATASGVKEVVAMAEVSATVRLLFTSSFSKQISYFRPSRLPVIFYRQDTSTCYGLLNF